MFLPCIATGIDFSVVFTYLAELIAFWVDELDLSKHLNLRGNERVQAKIFMQLIA